MTDKGPLPVGLQRWLLHDQFMRNVLGSVSIEYPQRRKHPRLRSDDYDDLFYEGSGDEERAHVPVQGE